MKKLIMVVSLLLILSSPALAFKTLIEGKTAAETTAVFGMTADRPVTLVAYGLTGAEEIELEVEYATTPSYADAYWEDEKIVFTATRNIISIIIYGRFRLVKPITSGTVGVIMYSKDNM